MYFDENLQSYIMEVDGVLCSWDEEPEGAYEEETKKLAEVYPRELPHIIKFMLPRIRIFYREITAHEVKEKVGRPIIEPEFGMFTYCEQSFDDVHLFTLEYADNDLAKLENFTIDG